MYLQRLELQGYKSFARKTNFAFDRGITAIVGPNGSGKSNVADAIQWVLGETRLGQLRAKLTDDLIFSGSDKRARLGMARASITLDNSEGLLPIDYSEVTIERRAYRDGQNEYLLNGTKVRLRDIVDLLGAGGLTRDAYTIIGQGLVDRVLYMRPQERRSLIDVAAGIRPLRDKRDRALRQLDETRHNLTRVLDITAEIEPQLRRLERQAERAREGAKVAEELAGVLQIWYGYQWYTGQQTLRDAQARAAATQQDLSRHRERVTALEQQIEDHRNHEEALLNRLSEHREQRGKLRSRYEAVRRDLAVRRERMTFLQRRREELLQEISDVQVQRRRQHAQLVEVTDKLAQLNEQCDWLEAQVASIQQKQAGALHQKTEYQQALNAARQEASEAANRIANVRNKLAALTERQEALTRERQTQEAAIDELEAQVHEHQQMLKRTVQQAGDQAEALEQLQSDRSAVQASLHQAIARYESLIQQAEAARRQLERIEARRDAQAEFHHEVVRTQAAGTQAILTHRSELNGIVGTVASLIRVPAQYERAIEAVLGPHLHAVVVETWDDAQHAIEWLNADGSGRATVIALEAIEAGQRHDMKPKNRLGGCLAAWLPPWGARETAEKSEGTNSPTSRAADLVDCEPRFQPLVEQLLGQAIVLENLDAIDVERPIEFSSESSGALTVVTLDGTVVRLPSQITGGTLETQVLQQERIGRQLDSEIDAAQAQLRQAEADGAAAQAEVDELRDQIAALDARYQHMATLHRETQSRVEHTQRDIEALNREIAWRRELVDQQATERERLSQQIAALEGEIEHFQAVHGAAQQQVEALQTQLDTLEAELLRNDLAGAEKQLALAQQDLDNQERRQRDLRTALDETDRQIHKKRKQIDHLTEETETLQTHIDAMIHDERLIDQQLQSLQAEIAPMEERIRQLRRDGRDREREAARARDDLRHAEAVASEASLDAQRSADRLLALRDRIADDLELTAIGEELPQQLSLELDGVAELLPTVTQIPQGLEHRVQQLRRQLRRLGSPNPELIAEYEETKERYDFLTSQASDLEEAAADLRAIAADLTEVMTERFITTFEELAQVFERYFTQLFGGGEAFISLTEEEDGAEPGLEIVARPPGKRPQSLALLSGGERTLTAIALLFALLQVSPTPFCALDEVDAMLDEANIGRFRALLEELADKTQFIIITHNRGTVEAADTIYGISMGDEGVSQAISLRLDELEPVPLR